MLALTVLLAQGSSTPTDTVVTRIVLPAASWFTQVADVASGLVAILTVLLFVSLLVVAVRMRRSFDRAQAALEDIGRDLRTLVERANGVAQHAGTLAEALHSDLNEVRETVDFANRRARHAVSQMADRVDEFNDSLATMQRDTRGMVVTALAAFRGLRAGMAAFKRRGRKPQPAEMVFDDDYDDEPEHDLPARPRLRRRARGDR